MYSNSKFAKNYDENWHESQNERQHESCHENHHEKCGLESKNFSTHDTLCGEKKIGVCNAKKITKMDRFVVTATI